LRIKYFIVLDGCPRDFEDIFTKNIRPEDIEIIRTDKIGNLATFNKQLDILSTQADAQLVYFAEDDYLYRPDQFREMVAFFREHDPVDFLTPYDHLDYYEHRIHLDAAPSPEVRRGNIIWKQAVSTCLSFLTSKEVLKETLPVFHTYGKGNTDSSLWLVLTKKYGFGAMLKYWFSNKECFFMLKKAMKYCFRRFFTGKRYHLWYPVPAIGTHLESRHISPGIDWDKVKKEVETI
jgi:hypothetical protein